jgi:hypothetical protein
MQSLGPDKREKQALQLGTVKNNLVGSYCAETLMPDGNHVRQCLGNETQALGVWKL